MIKSSGSDSDSDKNLFVLLSQKKKPLIFKQIVDNYLKFSCETLQDNVFEPFLLLNELEVDHFCRTILKLLHVLQVSELNLLLFSSVTYKCNVSLLRYVSSLIKSEFYSLDLLTEPLPMQKLKSLLNFYVETSLKTHRNGLFVINIGNLLENPPDYLPELLALLQNMADGYELEQGTFTKTTVEAFLNDRKTSDNGRHLNSYHHLHLLNESLSRKVRVVLLVNGNVFLQSAASIRRKKIFRDFEEFFRNYTRIYIYVKNISGDIDENVKGNEVFSRNVEKILNLSEENMDFVGKIKKAYIFEIEESKIILKESRKLNNLLSFQQFETVVCYAYSKIRDNLNNKFEMEKKSGLIGRVFDLQNAKFDKFNKEINKIISEKEKLEAEILNFDEKLNNNRAEAERLKNERKDLESTKFLLERKKNEVFGLLKSKEVKSQVFK